MTEPANHFEVAVVGAGPAGAATARRLALLGRRVVLLERTSFDRPRAGESLAPATHRLLTELGVWPEFVALSPLPSYGTRSIWGSAQPQDHTHLATLHGSGFHVDRTAFDRMLADSAATAGAALWLDARVRRCTLAPAGGYCLEVDRGGSTPPCLVHASVVIDAGGRNSPLARWLGARRVVFDQLVGVASQFMHEHAGEQCYTLIETGSDGWWYSAPVAPDRLVAMMMTDGDLTAATETRTIARFLEALNGAPATRDRLRGGDPAWGPKTFSAVSQRLVRGELSAPWFAVGDAALSVDPISGSGVVRALNAAMLGAQTAVALLDGKFEALDEYEANGHNQCTQYLYERAAYYGLERRFEGSSFWRRRLNP